MWDNIYKMQEDIQRVSVVMCTYNGEAFIEEQIESILNQTYPLFELLIVDDCSKDNTVAIVEKIATDKSLIKFYKNERNLGFTKNFEKALTLASGDFIAISDQDDVWEKSKIEKLVNNIPAASLLIYCNSVRFTQEIPKNPTGNSIYRRFEGTDVRKVSFFNTVSGHAVLLRKQLLQIALPIPDVIYDWWLAAVAACNGGVSYIPEILVYQRMHNANATFNNGFDHSDPKQLQAFKKMVIQHSKEFINIPNASLAAKNFFSVLHYLLNRSLHKNFDSRLFYFLLKYRKVIYYYKVRKIGIFSHVKHSFRIASCNGF